MGLLAGRRPRSTNNPKHSFIRNHDTRSTYIPKALQNKIMGSTWFRLPTHSNATYALLFLSKCGIAATYFGVRDLSVGWTVCLSTNTLTQV